MIKNFTQQKIYFLAGGLLTALVLVIFLAIIPLFNKFASQSYELAQKKQDAEVFYQNWQSLASVRQEYAKIKADLAAAKLLLEPDATIEFIKTLEGLAQKTGLRQEIALLDSPAAPAKKQLELQTTIWGSFPQVIKFMAYLENTSYLNEVQSLQIRRLQTSDLISQNISGLSSGDVQVIINLIVYQQ